MLYYIGFRCYYARATRRYRKAERKRLHLAQEYQKLLTSEKDVAVQE